MFTRSSQAEPQSLEPIKAEGNATRNTPQQPRQRPGASEPGPKSVIGNDLKIIGQGLKIISRGTLQVDGEVEGDVGGAEVIIGEKGSVTGTVAAARVIVRGTIFGVIRGADRNPAVVGARRRRHPPHVARHRAGRGIRRSMPARCQRLGASG